MKGFITSWLARKWQPPSDNMAGAVQAMFASVPGQIVKQHLLDSIYCTVYEGNDPMLCYAHNARRSVVHELLQLEDEAADPQKYKQVRVEGQ